MHVLTQMYLETQQACQLNLCMVTLFLLRNEFFNERSQSSEVPQVSSVPREE